MKRAIFHVGIVLAVLLGCAGLAANTHAQESDVPAAIVESSPEEFNKAEVTEIIEEHQEEFGLGGTKPTIQKVRVEFSTGMRVGQTQEVDYGFLQASQRLAVGDKVVVVSAGERTYVFDRYRLSALGVIAGLFALLALVFAGWRGVTSLVGLGVSVLVIVFFVVPSIMGGESPLLVSLAAALSIAVISIYLAHGISRRTSVAVVSTLITVTIAIGLAQLFVALARLTGIGSEEAYFLQSSPVSFINLKGLLLGGIVIGTLGVLDDITTAQAAAVEEIWRANPALPRRDLFLRAWSVGREHITSLVNTLALAYVGASFPALLLFTVYERPWWVVANTEAISEEIIRTLVGSCALMFAVPITTLLAVLVFSKRATSDIQRI